MATNTDSSRIFALCRDGVVYAYSTQHLVLGNVPEMQAGTTPSTYPTENGQGLGPLFGLKHPDLIVSSFYIKMALRPSLPGKPEMIATGSADGNVFILPTSEQTLKQQALDNNPLPIDPSSGTPLYDPQASSGQPSTPIYTTGTKLAHGHSAKCEVANVTWSRGGDVLSSGDDFRTRIWREDQEMAKLYRKNGAFIGQSTAQIGFAVVEDEEEGDLVELVDDLAI
jgi:hypothetical protein